MKVRAEIVRRYPSGNEWLVGQFTWGDDALVAAAGIWSATDPGEDECRIVVKFTGGSERVIGES